VFFYTAGVRDYGLLIMDIIEHFVFEKVKLDGKTQKFEGLMR
jgi:hypothetical protein